MHMQIALIIVLACMIGPVHAAENWANRPNPSQGSFQLNVTKGLLTLKANDARLTDIFQEIGKQAKISIDSNLGPEETITIQLDDVSLEEGLHRLAKNVTILYAQSPGEKQRRITSVIVLTEGTGQGSPPKHDETSKESSKTAKPAPLAPKRAEAPPADLKAKQTVPQPPPFKFEFDPATATKRDDSQKKP
jgi:hypothetical protein